MHIPPSQLPLVEHLVPQLPQLFMSVCALTQALLQKVPPFGQAHMPLEHTLRGLEQTVVQVPQWFASVCALTHSSPHAVSPPAQPQLLAAHVCAAEHAMPQPPQLSWLVARSTQLC